MAQWPRLRTPNAGDLGSIPGQRTRSHMHSATTSSHATKEPTWYNQINKYFFKKRLKKRKLFNESRFIYLLI